MKKTLLASAALLMLSLAANAQEYVCAGKLTDFAPVSAAAVKAPAKAQGTIEFSYFMSEYNSDNYYLFGLGNNSKVNETYDVGIKIPASYAGCTVKSVSFVLFDASILSNVKAWASASLPSKTGSFDVTESVANPVDVNGINTVTLSSPYTVPEGGCYVGYSFTMKSLSSSYQNAGKYPVIIESGTNPTEGGFFLRTSTVQTSWFDTWESGYDYNATTLVTLEGDFSDNEAAFPSTDLGSKVTAVNEATAANIEFTSYSVTPITSLGYTVKDVATGKVSAEKTVTGLNAEYGKSRSFTIDFDAEEAAGSYQKEITLTKVNGVENVNKSNVGTFTLNVLSKALPKASVIEEYTGTGCGYCPRGHVGMKKVREQFGDKFIGIAIHQYNSSDAMYNANYANLGFTGAPSCMIGRDGNILDPYYGSGSDIRTDFAASLETLPELGVSVKGEWNSDSTAVTVTADFESLVNGTYNVAYVLVADSLSGKTSAWKQSNYYAQYSASQLPDDMKFLASAGSSYYATYNDVMIGSSYSGTKNQAASIDVTADGTTSGSYTITMPTKSTLKKAIKYNNVYAVALVLNAKTGAIVNAAKALVGSDVTGISSVEADNANNTVVARYNVNGQQVSAPVRGINILKMADGSTRKVIVK